MFINLIQLQIPKIRKSWTNDNIEKVPVQQDRHEWNLDPGSDEVQFCEDISYTSVQRQSSLSVR